MWRTDFCSAVKTDFTPRTKFLIAHGYIGNILECMFEKYSHVFKILQT